MVGGFCFEYWSVGLLDTHSLYKYGFGHGVLGWGMELVDSPLVLNEHTSFVLSSAHMSQIEA